jgi:membrane associated rhomboid family serine protease
VLIPYNTDAPIYHFPFVTIGLIVVNCIIFAMTLNDPEQMEGWLLVCGDGLYPFQWLASNFMHAGPAHLIGNMFFLWGFGLVVEGKLGWWRFLLVYLIIGAIFGAIIQTAMLGSEGGYVLGASGILFGLMAMALFWAPKNDMSCVLWLGVFSRLVEVPITLFATIYLVLQITFAALHHFSLSSEMLHLTGAGIGTVFGIAFLKLDLVDCEGWDLFNVLKGRTGVRPELLAETKTAKPREPAPLRPNPVAHGRAKASPLPSSPEHAQRVVKRIEHCLSLDDSGSAVAHYKTQRLANPEWKLDEKELLTLIRALHKQSKWSESVRPMADYIQQFPKASIRMQMRLAQILLEVQRRPAKAMKVLAAIDGKKLPPELLPSYKKFLQKAKALREAGELELADADDDI